jgi:Trk K+ transport system NAD-binding subunit
MPLLGWRGVLQEIIVREHSPVAGKAIFELGLPRDYLVVLIARGDEFLIPNGSIVLKTGDRLLGLAKPETQSQVAEKVQNFTQNPDFLENSGPD